MSEETSGLNAPTKIFLVVFLVVIAVIFSVVFSWRPAPVDTSVMYDVYEFEEVGGLWQTDIQLDDQVYEAVFRFNPNQLDGVFISGNFSGFKKSPIFITFDPNASEDEFKYLALGASELTLHLVRALNFTVEAACTQNLSDACSGRPIVSCDGDESVILLSPLPPTQITLEGDCVIVSGVEMDLLKSVDRLLFQWYKIMR